MGTITLPEAMEQQAQEQGRAALYQEMRRPDGLLALGLGSGLSPLAPGTAGSLLALLAMPFLDQLSLMYYALVLVACFALGVWLCQGSGARLGRADHPAIVFDEWVGLWLALMIRPPGWLWLLLGFVLFRAFDILKPWPIGWLDRRVKGGLGVMLDDWIAGVFAGIALVIVAFTLGGEREFLRVPATLFNFP